VRIGAHLGADIGARVCWSAASCLFDAACCVFVYRVAGAVIARPALSGTQLPGAVPDDASGLIDPCTMLAPKSRISDCTNGSRVISCSASC
jgi:hypothetical protein